MVSLNQARKKNPVADTRALSFIEETEDTSALPTPADANLDRIIDPDDVDAFRDHLERLWRETRQRVLAIGRNLLNALEKLEDQPGRFEKLIEGLPFSRPIASQMIAIAKAVEERKLVEEEIPPSYSVAYQLTTLSDEEMKRARQHGIVRPDIGRKDIIDFKRSLRAAKPRQNTMDLRRLKAQRDRLRQALAEVENNIRLLEGSAVDGKPYRVVDDAEN
jgi:hypothetical protein